MKRLRVGVIGVGHLGSLHARMYAEIPAAELIGVMDTDAARADAIARDLHVTSFRTPEELLGRNMHELVHHTRADGTPHTAEDSHILRTLRDLTTVRISNEVFWRKDGTSFPVEYVARPQIEIPEDSEPDPNAAPTDPWADAGEEPKTPKGRACRIRRSNPWRRCA